MNDKTTKILLRRACRFAEMVAKGDAITHDIRGKAVDLYLELSETVQVPEDFEKLSPKAFLLIDELFGEKKIIQSISLIRSETGIGLRESKEFLKKIADYLGYENLTWIQEPAIDD